MSSSAISGPPTDRTRLRRASDRGRYDHETIAAILDEGMVAHVGFALDGRPWVMPMAYARIGDQLYLHGAVGNHALGAIAAGAEVCVTVTILDGLVLSRSAFHHSMNYRSVMVFGTGRPVDDPAEQRRAADALVEHIVPGRSADTRSPTELELRATRIIAVAIEEASAKLRTGPPKEDHADLGLGHWAGVLPLRLAAGAPIQHVEAPGDADLGIPGYLAEWEATGRAR
jgi:nitroimidazol reductase NimA-like FMN-containing flavoprotein (pyridoxamine 5'-phosphate oxidase superfamily)